MARQPEYGIMGAKLEAVQRPSMLRITLRDVHGRLKPVETDPNEGTVHEAVAHAVELVVQQPEDQCDPGRLGDLWKSRDSAPSVASFDHLVSQRDEGRGKAKIECPRGLGIDDQLEARDLLHWQIRRFLAV
jgi:hypothetical protein